MIGSAQFPNGEILFSERRLEMGHRAFFAPNFALYLGGAPDQPGLCGQYERISMIEGMQYPNQNLLTFIRGIHGID